MTAEQFIASRSEPARTIMTELQRQFNELGCAEDFKTIYVSYEIGGSVVAAAYPHQDGVEIALALEDDLSDPRLEDAGHLTWRSLPVLVDLSDSSEIDGVRDLLALAATRVRNQDHQVSLSNDEITQRKRRRSKG